MSNLFVLKSSDDWNKENKEMSEHRASTQCHIQTYTELILTHCFEWCVLVLGNLLEKFNLLILCIEKHDFTQYKMQLCNLNQRIPESTHTSG